MVHLYREWPSKCAYSEVCEEWKRWHVVWLYEDTEVIFLKEFEDCWKEVD